MGIDYFTYFYEVTKEFVFSTRQRDILSTIEGDPHAREVKALITEVRKMAIKKSFQLSEGFVASCDREDWVQLSMITMYECCVKYDRMRPFDNYVRFMVSRKLQDKQRTLMRKNPPADRDILRLYREVKKAKGCPSALSKLAMDNGRSIEQLHDLANSGVGQRIFVPETENISNMSASPEFLSPGVQAEAKELRTLLNACIEDLPKKSQALFLRHEIEEISLKRLFVESCCQRSFATFKRWYKSDVFQKVKQCVAAQIE